jgi:hypothetical protein
VLYSSRQAYDYVTIKHSFKLEDISRQFNNINHDLSNTQLNNLIEQKTGLPANETGGLSFLQGIIGLVIRIDFPSLNDILFLESVKITEAQLSLSPLPGSYNDSGIPSELVLYESDKQNNRNEKTASSSLVLDGLYHEDTAYLFDITRYINDEIIDSFVDPENGLIISLPTTEQNSKFSNLILDAQNQKTELKIYYLSY